ncbi:hypothetical protein PRIPAC_72570 [Pristionchus pacificus]|nr:hypothetical protein PRIPAC_72570 [Pristionchus pacificus]
MAGQQPRAGPLILPRIEPDFVRHVAESMGLTNLTINGNIYICEQVSHLLKRVVYDAHKFAIHGRRAKVVGGDVEAALRLAGLENLTPLGHTLPNPPPMVEVANPYGMENWFVPDDIEIDLAELREHPPQSLPAAPYLRAHWLVYNGKMPRVPENVQPEEVAKSEVSCAAAAAELAARRETSEATTSSAGASFKRDAREVATSEQVMVQPVPSEALSVEQQRYFKEIIETVVGTDDKRRQEALQSLEQDTGIQALLPRITRMIADSVRLNVAYRCMSMLIYLVRIVRSLLNNKTVKLEPYLHELLPSLVSCMIGRQLCMRPEVDNHWALRDFSAKTLVALINAFDKIPALRLRVYRTLRKTFDDPNSNYGQMFGCVYALNEIMTHQERYECYHRYVDLTNACHPSACTGLTPESKAEAGKLYQQLLKVETSMLRSYRTISEGL